MNSIPRDLPSSTAQEQFLRVLPREEAQRFMDGLRLCRLIRDDPDLAATPVLLITAYLAAQDPRLAAAGATVVVTKPFGVGELAVFGVSTQVVGELAHRHRLRLHELASRSASLEAAFLELVDGEAEYLQGVGVQR